MVSFAKMSHICTCVLDGTPTITTIILSPCLGTPVQKKKLLNLVHIMPEIISSSPSIEHRPVLVFTRISIAFSTLTNGTFYYYLYIASTKTRKMNKQVLNKIHSIFTLNKVQLWSKTRSSSSELN